MQVPATVTRIGNEAFYGCERFTAISLPEGLTSLGKRAFYEYEDISISLSAQKPPELGSDVFPSDARIFVPAASVNTCQRDPGWEDYRDQILPLG
jgi:hypothetical protein